MLNLKEMISEYLNECEFQRGLNVNTLKAYSIDLSQFLRYMEEKNGNLNKDNIAGYIEILYSKYSPKTIKRKVICLKTFCKDLEFKEYIEKNPFSMMRVKIKEPLTLPKAMSLREISGILSAAYNALRKKKVGTYVHSSTLRDVAILELLFATGARVSEICNLAPYDVDIINGSILIYGKGSKERIVQVGNIAVISALRSYYTEFNKKISSANKFFINRLGNGISDQSIRLMVKKYAGLAELDKRITPHMFRHTLATLLLEEEVDIRFIQKVLGHSSINTTQIYTHISSSKERYIMTERHPRNRIEVNEG